MKAERAVTHRRTVIKATLALAAMPLPSGSTNAQTPPAEPPAERAEVPLFAVELRTGSRWDHAKKAHEQAHFREHSSNLQRLREQQSLILGARYADKGLLILAAASEQDARKLMDQDPAIQNQVFAYELNPFAVFYSGCVQTPKRRAAQ